MLSLSFSLLSSVFVCVCVCIRFCTLTNLCCATVKTHAVALLVCTQAALRTKLATVLEPDRAMENIALLVIRTLHFYGFPCKTTWLESYRRDSVLIELDDEALVQTGFFANAAGHNTKQAARPVPLYKSAGTAFYNFLERVERR